MAAASGRNEMALERLQKILSRAGIASRRAGEKMIAEGRISVNRSVVTEPGTKADPERDDIRWTEDSSPWRPKSSTSRSTNLRGM